MKVRKTIRVRAVVIQLRWPERQHSLSASPNHIVLWGKGQQLPSSWILHVCGVHREPTQPQYTTCNKTVISNTQKEVYDLFTVVLNTACVLTRIHSCIDVTVCALVFPSGMPCAHTQVICRWFEHMLTLEFSYLPWFSLFLSSCRFLSAYSVLTIYHFFTHEMSRTKLSF